MSDECVVSLSTRRSTRLLACALGRILLPGNLLVLGGPLGAGKTYLVRRLARSLGLPESVPVTSPTFTLVQVIETAPRLVHADLYRLSSAREVAELGLAAEREHSVVIVEWGRPYVEVLGGDALWIELGLDPRRAVTRSLGPGAAARLRELQEHLEASKVGTDP